MFRLARMMFGDPAPTRRPETGGGHGAAHMEMTEGAASGLAGDTLIATAMGWRPAAAIARGDLVLTFDRGMQPVRQVQRVVAFTGDCPRAHWPLRVPAGALGNTREMLLLPDQPAMLESDVAEMLYGDPFALVEAADLEGFRGIERVHPDGAIETVVLRFEHDEVIFADQGALVHCAAHSLIGMDQVLSDALGAGYRSLPHDEARDLLACLVTEDAAAAGTLPGSRQQDYQAAAFGWGPKRA